ncbi:MAG TPA: transposase, partial [Paenirhodobacter sp.]
MTTDMMKLGDLVEKTPDADLLREMIGFAAERLMALDVGAATGAAYGEKEPARPAGRKAGDLARARGVSKVLSATWQRCRVPFQRNALAHAGKSGRRVVSAFIATAFAQETAEAASVQWRTVADQIRSKVPKLATIMD